MKKYLAILLSFLFISSISAKAADFAVGITGAYHSIDTDGQERLRNSGKSLKHLNQRM